MMPIPNTNDHTDNAPYLRIDLVEETLHDLPPALQQSKQEHYTFFAKEGFAGIQNGGPALCKNLGLRYTMSGRISQTGEVEKLIVAAKNKEADCITLHVGTGLESDAVADRLIEDILNQAEKLDFPVYIETHRATITQDMYRTVELIRLFRKSGSTVISLTGTPDRKCGMEVLLLWMKNWPSSNLYWSGYAFFMAASEMEGACK